MIASSIDQVPMIGAFDDTARGRLLRGAAYLFHKQGFDKTTVRELAQFIGIQSGSLFHHFKSKDDILEAVMEQAIIYNLAQMHSAVESSDQPIEQLRALIKAEINSITGDTGAAMAVLVHEWSRLPKTRQDYLLGMRKEYEQIWLDVFEQLKAAGKIKHDAFLWRRLLGGAISWMVTWYKPNGKVKLDEMVDMVLDMAVAQL